MVPIRTEALNLNGMTVAGAMKGCTGTVGATARHVVPQPIIVPFLLP